MNGTSEGSAGGQSFAGWPAPVPSCTQPADTSSAPQSGVQVDPTLPSNAALELGNRIHAEIELAVLALNAPYDARNVLPVDYAELAERIYKPMPTNK